MNGRLFLLCLSIALLGCKGSEVLPDGKFAAGTAFKDKDGKLDVVAYANTVVVARQL